MNAVVSSIVGMTPNTKLLKYSYLEQISDLLPNLLSSAIMIAVVWPLSLLIHNNLLLLMSQIVLGVAVYILISVVTRNASFRYIIGMIKKK